MSDIGRKDLHTKLGESMTPNSTKSTSQKIKESFTDTGDKVVRYVMLTLSSLPQVQQLTITTAAPSPTHPSPTASR
jgi:hypothetical protein